MYFIKNMLDLRKKPGNLVPSQKIVICYLSCPMPETNDKRIGGMVFIKNCTGAFKETLNTMMYAFSPKTETAYVSFTFRIKYEIYIL